MPIQGLLSNIPQLDPSLANVGAPVIGGLQAAQQQQLMQAQAQNLQLQNHIQNLQTTQQLAAMVRYHPSQENYDNVRKLATNAGLGDLVNTLPPDIQSAYPLIDSAYWSSGQGLARAKATADILSAQINMGKNAAQANLANYNQGQNPVFSGTAQGNIGTGNTGIDQLPPGPINNDGTLMNSGNQSANPMQGAMMPSPGMQTQTPQGMGGQPLLPASSVPTMGGSGIPGASSNLTPKAEMEQQTAQAKDWADFRKGVAATDSGYDQTNQTLNQVDNILGSGALSTKLAGPLMPDVIANYNNNLSQLNTLGKALNLNFTKSFATGLGRIDIPLVRAIQFLSPGSDKTVAQSQLETNRIRYGNELNHATSQLLPTLDQLQIRDPNQAGLMIQNAVAKTNAVDSKSGKIDMNKFNNWPNNLPQNVKDAYYTNNYVSQGIPVFKNAKGDYLTGNQIQHMAQLSKTDPQTIMNKYKLQPALQSQNIITQQQQQQLAQAQQQNSNLLG